MHDGRHVSTLDKVVAGLGFALHLLIAVFPFAATGLLAPPWAYLAVYAWWLGLAFVAVRLVRARPRPRPRLVLVVPVIALAGWFALVSFGDVVLGWTA